MADETMTFKAQEAPPMGKGSDCVLSTLAMRGGLGCPPGDVVIQAPDCTELARIKPDGKVELHADTDEVARNFWEAIGQVRIAWTCPELERLTKSGLLATVTGPTREHLGPVDSALATIEVLHAEILDLHKALKEKS